MTQSVLEDKSYIASRAWLLKQRWQRRLNDQELESQTERLMPGRNGQNYRADIVLQDPKDGLPVVVFEVKAPAKTMLETRQNLERILDTRRFIELLGGKRPTVVLVVSPPEEQAGRELVEALNAADLDVEVM